MKTPLKVSLFFVTCVFFANDAMSLNNESITLPLRSAELSSTSEASVSTDQLFFPRVELELGLGVSELHYKEGPQSLDFQQSALPKMALSFMSESFSRQSFAFTGFIMVHIQSLSRKTLEDMQNMYLASANVGCKFSYELSTNNSVFSKIHIGPLKALTSRSKLSDSNSYLGLDSGLSLGLQRNFKTSFFDTGPFSMHLALSRGMNFVESTGYASTAVVAGAGFPL